MTKKTTDSECTCCDAMQRYSLDDARPDVVFLVGLAVGAGLFVVEEIAPLCEKHRMMLQTDIQELFELGKDTLDS